MTYTSVPRFFIAGDQITQQQAIVEAADVAHLAALRLRSGEVIELVIDDHSIRKVTLSRVEKAVIQFSTYEERPLPPAVTPKITLIQALPKGDKLSEIINHCTQLGISNLILWQSERSISTPSDQKWPSKVARLQQVVRNAAMQSKQDRIPTIALQLMRTNDLTQIDATQKILLWEEERSHSLKQLLSATPAPSSIVVVVGPEGGITPQEAATLQSAGFRPTGLGDSILRVEVAAFSAISLIRFWYGK